MFCSKCGNQIGEGLNFCRSCGSELEATLLAKATSKDPDEMTASGVCNVIIGDGFFMVAVLLSATHSPVSSLLWLFLLIPAFYFFGKGFAEVLHARQIRRRQKQNELNEGAGKAELPQPRISFIDTVRKSTSGEIAYVPSVTERTTRDLS